MKMKYNGIFLAKIVLIFIGILFLLYVCLGESEPKLTQPQGEGISKEDVSILLDAAGMEFNFSDAPGSYLIYEEYMKICDSASKKNIELPKYEERYLKEMYLLKEDWYAAYNTMLEYLGLTQIIREAKIVTLQVDVKNHTLFANNEETFDSIQYRSSAFQEKKFQKLRVYIKDDICLTVIEQLPGEYVLPNVWIKEAGGGNLSCFYKQVNFDVDIGREILDGQDMSIHREQVADLIFESGKIKDVHGKGEKIHGKILRISAEEIEIEGHGCYRMRENMEVYKLYGELETLSYTDLKIGYDDTDFVVDSNTICAALVSREENAQTIRVLLRNTTTGDYYCDEVVLWVNEEEIICRCKDMEIGERRYFQSDNLTDRIAIQADGISREDNAYRGTIECYRTKEGMVLINELLLEEYLYAVVPSEMPASYPMEALKAQAVCARTYAYRYMQNAGLPELGAHVDDTTAFQVYHNCPEHATTTTAVKETDGIVLVYQGKPAENYYFSTSCGVTTDTGVWKKGDGRDTSYMHATRLSSGDENAKDTNIKDINIKDTNIKDTSTKDTSTIDTSTEDTGSKDIQVDDLQKETVFERFITAVDEKDYESEEPWYRWRYDVHEMDEKVLFSRMKERYETVPECVLTKSDGEYVSKSIPKAESIVDLCIEKRGPGGVADELLIITKKNTYKIIAEYNIRYILCDGKSVVTKQDDSTTIPGTLVPSGFFVLKTGKHGKSVVGYTLIGGGYGHGVGMSQNGAKNLGEEGLDYKQILQTFFEGCELERL